MYRELLRDVRFFVLLLQIDREKLEETRAGKCPHCEGPLHAGHFERKPRGILCSDSLPEGYERRFDLCCGWCRVRTMPPSVRFLGRKVYVAAAVTIATVLVRSGDRDAVRFLRRELGASGSTLLRWRQWWRALTGSAFWQTIRGWLPVDLDESGIPRSLLERLSGSLADRMRGLLVLLGPITARAYVSAQVESR